jgi:hypothetical protein
VNLVVFIFGEDKKESITSMPTKLLKTQTAVCEKLLIYQTCIHLSCNLESLLALVLEGVVASTRVG